MLRREPAIIVLIKLMVFWFFWLFFVPSARSGACCLLKFICLYYLFSFAGHFLTFDNNLDWLVIGLLLLIVIPIEIRIFHKVSIPIRCFLDENSDLRTRLFLFRFLLTLAFLGLCLFLLWLNIFHYWIWTRLWLGFWLWLRFRVIHEIPSSDFDELLLELNFIFLC